MSGDNMTIFFWLLHFLQQPLFARVEGILPTLESSYAIKVAIDEALRCKETGEELHSK